MKDRKELLSEALSFYAFAKDDSTQFAPLPLNEQDFHINKGCTAVFNHVVESNDFQEIKDSAIAIITKYENVIDNYMLSVSYSNPNLTREEDRNFCENVIYEITRIFDDELFQDSKIGLIINPKQIFKYKLIIHLIAKE